MKYAFIILTALIVCSATGGASLPSEPGWLGLGYTYNVTRAQNARVVWLFVRQIAPGGPADRAGIHPQDLITAINGIKLTFNDDLDALNFFNQIRRGQRLRLTISRGRSVRLIALVAGSLPPGMAEQRRINADIAKRQRQQAH